MKRHGDRKAYFEKRQTGSFQWSGKVGDRDAAASQQQGGRDVDSSDPGTPAASISSPAASPPPEQRTVRDLTLSAAKDAEPVPVGEHHQGSFGVYMAHKMDKLRHQVDGGVARLEGTVVPPVPFHPPVSASAGAQQGTNMLSLPPLVLRSWAKPACAPEEP